MGVIMLVGLVFGLLLALTITVNLLNQQKKIIQEITNIRFHSKPPCK